MANIIYDARKIKLMEAVKELSDLVGNSDEWFNSFWSLVMENENIYEELLYYIDHHDLLCSYTIENYSIVDLFVWQLSNYDPGVGYAKSLEQNLIAINTLDKLCALGYPVLLGTSRKSVVGLTLDLPRDERVEGTIATSVIGLMRGASIFRVHDVKENFRALKMAAAVIGKSFNA